MTAPALSVPELLIRLDPQRASTHAITPAYHGQWSAMEPLAMCGAVLRAWKKVGKG